MNVRVIHLKTGKVEEVSEGYARNYLIPHKLAKLASSNEVAQAKQKQHQDQKKQSTQSQEWNNLAKKLPSMQIELTAPASASGTLYERVHESDILSALEQQHHVKLNPSWLKLESIKQVGLCSVKVQFPNSLTSQLHVNIKAK